MFCVKTKVKIFLSTFALIFDLLRRSCSGKRKHDSKLKYLPVLLDSHLKVNNPEQDDEQSFHTKLHTVQFEMYFPPRKVLDSQRFTFRAQDCLGDEQWFKI